MLKVEHLSVTIDTRGQRICPVSDVSFEVRPGQTYAIVGESGCGKSMTAMALMRLLPPAARVTQGRVLLGAEDLLDLPEVRMQRVRGGKIAMIFQEPGTSLNPVMTIGDQLVEAIRLHENVSLAEAKAQACRWLERVGIDHAAERMSAFAFELSGGQKQRVMIAMALAMKPEVVIADEPTTALDVTMQAQILDLLKQLQKETGQALVMITHDLAVVQQMADRVALMYAGQIVEEADVGPFFSRPLHPYARSLLAAIPSERKRDRTLEAIEGTVPTLTEGLRGCRFTPRCPLARPACRSQEIALQALEDGRRVRCDRCHAAQENSRADRAMPMTRLGDTLLEMRDVAVTYERSGGFLRPKLRFEAVKGATLSIRVGETLALVGESGSGKTTLGKAALSLLPDARVSGQIVIDGQDVVTASSRELHALRRKAQIVFQDPFASLNPRMTIGESILEGMQALGVGADRAQRERKMRELLRRVGLNDEAATRLPHEFSGGQRQRVAIARALAVEPKLIVCDEPTSALDVSVQAQILNLLKELQHELGIAYLFITHNFAVVDYMADTVAVMQGGQIVEQGRADEVLKAPKHPYTQRLLAAVPRLTEKAY